MQESRIFNPLDLKLSRSVYDINNHSMGTCLVGRLIPAYTFNVLPGCEMSMKLHSLFKMSTPVYPTMDYLYADIAFYYVPYKAVLSRRYGTPSVNDASESWAGFIGAQDFAVNMPIPSQGVEMILVDANSSPVGSLSNYLYGPDGFNSGSYGIYLNCLPAISYFSIWNENYREPNVQTPVTWSLVASGSHKFLIPASTPNICIADCEVSAVRPGETAGSYVGALTVGPGSHHLNTCLPLPTSVFHGYFGSLLPWPQRNLTGVALPVGGFAPLKVGSAFTSLGGIPSISSYNFVGEGVNIDDTNLQTGGLLAAYKTSGNALGLAQASASSQSNLGIDLSSASAVDVEMLRALITKQHWYEDLARSGNRLDELEYGTFGVRPKDSGLDRPMYLGGKRIPLSVEMVASTNGGSTSGAAAGAGSLGDLGAFSHTNDEDFYFHHGFDSWGAVQCVFTIRTHNLIASGIDRHWMKLDRDSWYWPEFANLGNQAIWKKEVQSVTPASGFGTAVLGYQEYAEEWRTPRNLVTGLLVPGQSLGFMTYAHRYDGSNAATTLAQVLDASKQFIDVDRTLSVTQASSGFQFIYQFTFDGKLRSPVGKYSAPGVSRI